MFSNKQAPDVPSKMLRNPSFSSFASFLTVSLTPIINKPDSWTQTFREIFEIYIS